VNTILLVLLAFVAGWRGRGARLAGRVRSWTVAGFRLTLRGESDYLEIESARGEGDSTSQAGEARPYSAALPEPASPALSWCPSCGEAMQDGYCANCDATPLNLSDFDTTMTKLALDMQRARDGLKVRTLLESVGLTREVDG